MNATPEFSTQSKSIPSACDKLLRLSDLTLKSDYDFTIQLYDGEDSETPACSHHFKGNIKRSLISVAALGGILMGMAATAALTFHFCGSVMRKFK